MPLGKLAQIELDKNIEELGKKLIGSEFTAAEKKETECAYQLTALVDIFKANPDDVNGFKTGVKAKYKGDGSKQPLDEKVVDKNLERLYASLKAVEKRLSKEGKDFDSDAIAAKCMKTPGIWIEIKNIFATIFGLGGLLFDSEKDQLKAAGKFAAKHHPENRESFGQTI